VCLIVCLSVCPFVRPYALSQVAEATPLALRRFGFTTAFSAEILAVGSGMPDLVLAILFAFKNDISAAIDVGLAAALTVTMCVYLILVFVDMLSAHYLARKLICDEAAAVVAVLVC
jgi:Ca2+/H+ antiporter